MIKRAPNGTETTMIVPGTSSGWDDTEITVGQGYEYRVRATRVAGANPPFAFGNVFTGIDLALVEDKGRAVLVVENRLELLRLNANQKASRVVTAMTMCKRYLYENGGRIEAALVLGGCDSNGEGSLYSVYPHGSTDKLPYTSMGSGSLAAMSGTFFLL